eukprot:2895257-Rhodomonas_salina.1
MAQDVRELRQELAQQLSAKEVELNKKEVELSEKAVQLQQALDLLQQVDAALHEGSGSATDEEGVVGGTQSVLETGRGMAQQVRELRQELTQQL